MENKIRFESDKVVKVKSARYLYKATLQFPNGEQVLETEAYTIPKLAEKLQVSVNTVRRAMTRKHPRTYSHIKVTREALKRV